MTDTNVPWGDNGYYIDNNDKKLEYEFQYLREIMIFKKIKENLDIRTLSAIEIMGSNTKLLYNVKEIFLAINTKRARLSIDINIINFNDIKDSCDIIYYQYK